MAETKIFLHPLVIMNIADHQARKIADQKDYNPKEPPRILGAVFGIQKNQNIEIFSSIELFYELDNEKQIRIDSDAFGEDTDLFKQIYPDHELLGWYSTASEILPTDLPFHKKFSEYNESPLYIRMDPNIKKDAKGIPVTVYRLELKVVKDSANTMQFVELPFKIVSEPAERVATDHIINDKEGASKGSQIVPEFETLKNATKSLQHRVKLLIDYLDAVEKGKIKPDQGILQGINSVCNRLPTMVNEKFQEDFHSELANSMMMTYLASMNKTGDQVDKMLDLYESLNDGGIRGGRRGGGGGRGIGKLF